MSSPLAIPGVVPATQLQRPVAPTVPCGIAAVDQFTGGLPRGALTEICGPASSGRSTLLFSVLAEATRRQEICALVDVGDSFDPHSAAGAGVDLDRLLWIRCAAFRKSELRTAIGRMSPARMQPQAQMFSRVEQALKATDLLLQGGGFGLIAVDLADVTPEVARRVPLASWFRFRRAVEHTTTVLLVIEQQPYAKTCASLVLKTAHGDQQWAIRKTAGMATGTPDSAAEGATSAITHAQLFRGISVEVEVLRARDSKKPPRSTTATFNSRAEWAG